MSAELRLGGENGSCSDAHNYPELEFEHLVSLASKGDRLAFDEMIRRAESEPRQLDYDYELRHPGHGDQSVHNPHKGGGAAAGGWTPGGLKLQPKKTREEWRAEILAADPAKLKGRADSLSKIMVKRHENVDTYKNGDVEIQDYRTRNGHYKAPIPPGELAMMDQTAGAIVTKYGGPLTVKYKDIDEPDVFGQAELGSRVMTVSPKTQTLESHYILGEKAGNQMEYVMWHEAGHALPMKGAKPGFITDSAATKIIESAQANVASRVPNLAVGFEPGKQNILMVGTAYGASDAFEWHAESFAIHNLGVPLKGFTKQVHSEYAKEMGWGD